MTALLDVETTTGFITPQTSRAAIVRAENVVKTYDTGKARFDALKNVSLEIASGEVVGVMGPSGRYHSTIEFTIPNVSRSAMRGSMSARSVPSSREASNSVVASDPRVCTARATLELCAV